MDFYTSPIIVEVDGVDVRLKVLGGDDPKDQNSSKMQRPGKIGDESGIVPNTVDLAQSFLDTQSLADKKKLEDALAAETQGLGASITMSDSVSEDDITLGTGQPLSLPAFMADFLQGIVDRTQIRILGVTFQLDVEVPVEPNSSAPDLVTFQIALDGINVEGVTAPATEQDGTPLIVPKEGKRLVSLSNIRAYLISEANVFSNLARSPSLSSPTVSQSPAPTERGLLSKQSSTLSERMYDSHLEDSTDLSPPDDLLQDSEDALNIPYDFSSQPEEVDDDNPATPRASIYQDFGALPTMAPTWHSTVMGDDPPLWETIGRETQSEPSLQPPEVEDITLAQTRGERTPEGSIHSSSASDNSGQGLEDELAQSHVFTHEEAESMYMSAFSQAQSQQMRTSMPGSWDIETPSPELSPLAVRTFNLDKTEKEQLTSELQDTTTVDGRFRIELPVDSAVLEPDVATPKNESPLAIEPAGRPIEEEISGAILPQDDIPTPRGPTRLVKEIFSMKNISVYIPSLHKHIHVTQNANTSVAQLPPATYGLDRSVRPHIPGSFSVCSASVTSDQPTSPRFQPPEPTNITLADSSLEIILSPLDIQVDMSLGFLLAMVVSKLMDALKVDKDVVTKVDNSAKPDTTSSMPEIKLIAERISLSFLNQLVGIADTPERLLDPAEIHFARDVLLKTTLQNLKISTKAVGANVETSVDLEKFRFGYTNDDIIAFDPNLQMRASVRDAFPSAGADVSMKIVKSASGVRTEITTLPLSIRVDLQRLDETFSWFGGLSSFLNMGSSMTSSASPSLKSPVIPPPAAPSSKPRGVRFDTPISPEDKSASSENKIDMRIGGFNLELVGRECTIGLETSAVKMVSRDEGLGFGISRIRLAGPYLRYSNLDPPITADIQNARFEYLNFPKEHDLERLLELIIPSKVKFDQGDDEIMVDTLLKQRRKGPVLRVTLEKFDVRVGNIAQLACLPTLGEEVARLATVAKYLPEDDRPGVLTLAKIQNLSAVADFEGKLGVITAGFRDFEVAHISLPSLVAVGINSISVGRNHREELVGSGSTSPRDIPSQAPVFMARVIGDEIEPIIKIKMRDLNIEYRVPTIMDILGLAEDATPQDFEASLAASVANLGDQAHTALARRSSQAVVRTVDSSRATASKPTTVDIVFKDCLIGLNPLGSTSKLILALTDAHLEVVLPKEVDTKASLHLNKASVLLTDDVSATGEKDAPTSHRRNLSDVSSQQVTVLASRGYVNICYISSAKITVSVTELEKTGEKQIDVELRDDLLVIETCADSTQTLIALANALKPPTPPSKENKYRTKVVPVQDLLASISAEAFGRAEGDYDFDNDFAIAQELGGDELYDEAQDDSPLAVDSRYYDDTPVVEQLFDATGSMVSDTTTTQETNDGVLLTNFGTSSDSMSVDSEELIIQENYFGKGSSLDGVAYVWNSSQNTYDRAPEVLVQRSPLRVAVRDVHVIWNLFDGYDWARTRDVISKAVHDVEEKAQARRQRSERRAVYEEEFEDEETVIGDFLFNSIYIGIPANRDPRELTQAINQELNDNATETASVATTAFTTTTGRTSGPSRTRKKLRLNRSKQHKITFELKGVNVDMISFPPGSGETEASIDIRIQSLDIFDHVPTSTWKKFVTYDQDAGEREMDNSMVHLELLNVKPIPDLAASEMVVRVTLLPLRLHVDQDALDFITRFFEFKDDSVPVHSSPSDIPFLQRVEVNDIPVKLDFKPKRVDYAGLRSGHTTEFMNFIVLDEARMVLRHTIIYGVSGFDRLGKTLNDIWMPDVKRTQLPTVLAGLAPVRSIVNVSSGIKDLVEIPLKEYKKDGRIVRSIGKGAAAFARTTGTELVKLGAKLAIGTQYALQGAEGMLTNTRADTNWDDDEVEPEDKKQISLYADQPSNVIHGLRGGYSSLTRDLNMARDAIIAIPGEVMESGNAQGAAKAVLKRAPTIIFRPAIGATKAIGQTLMGATNTLDPDNRRRVDEVYHQSTLFPRTHVLRSYY
jgi:autophagy-related protein 2